MIEYNHYYALTPDWYIEMAQQMGLELQKDNKLMIFPESLGTAHSYFTEVIPGVSVLLFDAVLSNPFNVKRRPSNNDLYIIYFDLSDVVNLIKVENISHHIGYSINLGLAIVSDNHTSNSYTYYNVGERQFIIRLLVDKKLLSPIVDVKNTDKKNSKNNKLGKKKLFFYDHIDSNSKVLMLSLKNESVHKESFDYLLKGVALKLLSNFIERYSKNTPTLNNISEIEADALNATKLHLINNLYGFFPGVPFLAEMAGMSVTKYKVSFRSMFLETPNKFFIREKMLLANQLLQSKSFSSVAKVALELNYTKHTYFSNRYFEFIGNKPSEDFIPKEELD